MKSRRVMTGVSQLEVNGPDRLICVHADYIVTWLHSLKHLFLLQIVRKAVRSTTAHIGSSRFLNRILTIRLAGRSQLRWAKRLICIVESETWETELYVNLIAYHLQFATDLDTQHFNYHPTQPCPTFSDPT